MVKHLGFILLACFMTSCARERIALQLSENPSNRMEFAGEQLKSMDMRCFMSREVLWQVRKI